MKENWVKSKNKMGKEEVSFPKLANNIADHFHAEKDNYRAIYGSDEAIRSRERLQKVKLLAGAYVSTTWSRMPFYRGIIYMYRK